MDGFGSFILGIGWMGLVALFGVIMWEDIVYRRVLICGILFIGIICHI